MLGPVDYVLWFLGVLAEIAVVVCVFRRRSFRRRSFRRYYSLVFYILCDICVTFGLYYCVKHFGFTSPRYAYFYYYSDSLLTLLLFWVIIQFYLQTFEEMGASQYIGWAAAIMIVATAVFSYAVVHQNRGNLTSRFVVELGQNLYFVGVVLTYLLWGAILKLRETRMRLIQLVLALGIYFSADAVAYALRNLFPSLQPNFLRWIPPMMGVWLPVAWAYTMTKVSEDSRLAPARLMVKV
jgi:hypothetical protein